MAKESKKCESLRMAYKSQLIAFEDLIAQNKEMFVELDFERAMRLSAEARRDDVINENLKLSKKKRRKPLFIVGAAALAFAAGVIIAK